MSLLVVLNFGKGSWQQGFPSITAQLGETGSATALKVTGSLPPAVEVVQLYRRWRSLYLALSDRIPSDRIPSDRIPSDRMMTGGLREAKPRAAGTAQPPTTLHTLQDTIEFDDGDPAQVSEVEFDDLCDRLESQFNRWLDCPSFGKIERRLRTKLGTDDEVRVAIETEDELLRHLPWHLWSFFEDYPQAELALSIPEYEHVKPSQPRLNGRVRILAILGNSVGIQVDRDRAILEALPGSEVKVLAEPHREELQQFLWDERGWDILFFAGHSSSHVGGASGQIELNQTDSLTVFQLKHALRAAIARGLQLAVFNSCDGLGLARSLADLHVPQLVVMREPVPDRVAQEFLKQFLTVFARGKSFYLAVREAREKLQSLEGDYPCASWLPVICQNPATIPPTWWELSRDPFIEPLRLQRQRSLRAVLLTSALATLIAVGAQQLGWLERWELRAFDHLVQLRPAEPPDDRLLVVTVTARDVESQPIRERGDRSISDSKLEQLLTRLVSLEPRLIGLDIYRDLPASPQQPALSALLRQSDRLVTVCKTGEPDDNSSDISPAPELLDGSGVPLPGRVGFSDVVTDVDGVLRRHLLGFAPPDGSACATSISFSLLVAARYLQAEDIEIRKTPEDELFLGDLRLNLLSSDVASYHNLDAMGYQILLNYRAGDAIAQQYTLAEVLDGTALTADKVRDRIVLIGTTDRTFHDVHATPYTTESYDRTPGVLIQAHAISQLLSAVLDDRPLLWWLPHWAEVLWTGSWATVGGLLVWRWRSLIWIGLGQNVVLGVLYGSCYVFLLQGGWLPLIPPALAFLLSIGMAIAVPLP